MENFTGQAKYDFLAIQGGYPTLKLGFDWMENTGFLTDLRKTERFQAVLEKYRRYAE